MILVIEKFIRFLDKSYIDFQLYEPADDEGWYIQQMIIGFAHSCRDIKVITTLSLHLESTQSIEKVRDKDESS